MTPVPDEIRQLQDQRAQIKSQIMALGDFRPGWLVERYRKCGKPSCHCAAKDSAAHGPSWSLTRPVHGKTVTKVIPSGPAVERTRQHLAEYRRFRALIEQFVGVSERLCDTQIQAPRAASKEAAKKGGSKKPSTRKSSPRSKTS